MASTPEVEEKHDAAARLDDLLADQGKTSGILASPQLFYQPGQQYCELYMQIFGKAKPPPSAQPSICDAHIAQT